ncbi:response regulator transcription factor [Spirosoma areae]
MKPPRHLQNRTEGAPEAIIPNRGIFELTPREWEVLIHINDDLTNAEIADRLNLTTKSVVNYRNRIGSKLDLQGARKLARFVRKHQDELRQWHELLTDKCPSGDLVT